MANLTEAYDFSLFEEKKVESAAPQIPEKEERAARSPKANVVELPKKELEKNRRQKIHPVKMLFTTLCFGVILSTVSLLVYNQLQLTELTAKLNSAAVTLNDARTMETYLTMKTTQALGGEQVETYAQEVLGMSKITEGQVTYVNMAQEDQGQVLQSEAPSFLENIWNQFCALFA